MFGRGGSTCRGMMNVDKLKKSVNTCVAGKKHQGTKKSFGGRDEFAHAFVVRSVIKRKTFGSENECVRAFVAPSIIKRRKMPEMYKQKKGLKTL